MYKYETRFLISHDLVTNNKLHTKKIEITFLIKSLFYIFTDYRTVSDNEVFFGSPMEVDDIPEYEIMQWHEPRGRENLRIVTISEASDFVPLINEENASDQILIPTKTTIRSKIGNYSITVETKPIGPNQNQNITPVSMIDKTNDGNEDPPLHRIIVRDEDIKPIIGVDKPAVISKPATSVTKPAVSIPKPAANIAKPTSTVSKPAVSISKPAVGVKPATAITIKQDTSAKPTLTISNPLASVSKPAVSIKPATAISIKPATSVKPAAIIKPVINKPAITVSKPGTTVSKPAISVNKPVTNSQKPVKQDPPKPTTPPAAASINPCKCAYGQCMCCTGPLLDLFSQKACMKVIYIPEDFAFDYTLLLNKRVLYQDKISGKFIQFSYNY